MLVHHGTHLSKLRNWYADIADSPTQLATTVAKHPEICLLTCRALDIGLVRRGQQADSGHPNRLHSIAGWMEVACRG
jgi:hypothetical protein